MKTLRPIGYDDRLSVVDHLDELRHRLIVSGATLLVAFLACFTFNHGLINALNRALPTQPRTGLGSQPTQDAKLHRALNQVSAAATALQEGLAGSPGVKPAAVAAAGQLAGAAHRAASAVHGSSSYQEKPITTGVGESFTVTLLVSAYFALLFSLPVLLYQLYAFILPALSPNERHVALPAMLAAPALFIAGAVFTYFEVLPPAVHFLQGYNSDQFQILIGANTYYRFEILLMVGIGLAFQVPLLLLALHRIGAITASTLTVNWRYAIVIIAVIAAALPGVDPVTMLFETLPLIALYLASIVMLHLVERRARRRADAEALTDAP